MRVADDLGWLDDLTRFQHLTSLNLADNDLKTFPIVICHLPRLIDLNLASNGIDCIPSDIEKLQRYGVLSIKAFVRERKPILCLQHGDSQSTKQPSLRLTHGSGKSQTTARVLSGF
jgi:hypothetical protein